MSRFNDSELSRKIDDTIVEHLQTGEPTADEVSQDVLTQYDVLIREYGHELAVSQIRSIVSGRMKKILATRKGNALQLRLGAQSELMHAIEVRLAQLEQTYAAKMTVVTKNNSQ